MATILQRWRILFAAALVTVSGTARGQNAAHWSSYKMADGLAEAVFNTVSFTPQGKLIATSLNAPLAAVLDGYSVSNVLAPAECLGRICESPGGQRWAVVPQGLAEFKDGNWQLHPVAEFSAHFRRPVASGDSVLRFLPTRQGCVLLLWPDRLTEFNASNPDALQTVPLRLAAETHLGAFTGMAAARDGGMWISGTRGLAKVPGPLRNLETNTVWQEFTPPDSMNLGRLSLPVPDVNGGVILIAETANPGQTAVVTFDAGRWTEIPSDGRNFVRAWAGPDDDLWAATTESLFEWDAARTNWVENSTISAGQIFDVETEPDGAFWLATADGLFRCGPPLWSKPDSVRDLDVSVSALAPGDEGEVYFIAGKDLCVVQDKVRRTFPLPREMQSDPAAARLFALKNGVLLAAGGQGTFKLNLHDAPAGAAPVPVTIPSAKPLGRLPDGNLCIYGGEPAGFGEFDGTTFTPLAGLPAFHGNADGLATFFVAQNGDYWLGGGRETWRWHNGQWQSFSSPDSTTPEHAVAFTELMDGHIWCATINELWQFDGTGWIRLPARFNHINALLSSRTGNVWLASNGGLFRFSSGAWLENGPAEGLADGPVAALGEDQPGRIWAATAHGLMRFHPEANPDPPRTYVRRLDAGNRHLSEGDPVNLQLSGQDKWKYLPRYWLLYSYQLDQLGWSPSATIRP